MKPLRFLTLPLLLLACAERPETAEDIYERASGHAASCTTHLHRGDLVEADRAMKAANAEISRWFAAGDAARRGQPVSGQSLEQWRRYWKERAEVVAEIHFDQVLARLADGTLREADVEAFVTEYSTGVLRGRWEKARPQAAEASAKRSDGAYRFRCVERVDPSRLAGRSPEPGLVCRTLLEVLRERAGGVSIVEEAPPPEGVEDTAVGEIRVRWWADWVRFPDANPERGDWQLAKKITAALEVASVDGPTGWDGTHRLEADVALPSVERLSGEPRDMLAEVEREAFEEVRKTWAPLVETWGSFGRRE